MSNAELQALKEQRTALIKVINQMYVQQQYTDEMGESTMPAATGTGKLHLLSDKEGRR